MFTLEQIDELHARLNRADTLADHVRALHAIGVEKYDAYLTDGHSEYFGSRGHKVVSPPAHEHLSIAETSDGGRLLQHLKRHEGGETSYLDMSREPAESDVERWTVDTVAMTMTHSDRLGNGLLVEVIGTGL